jgi:hypothetical protein
LNDVVLLPNETIPIFGTCADMSSEISFLTYLVRSSEVWAVSSKVSGPFETDRLEVVLGTIEKLEKFLLCMEGDEHSSSHTSSPILSKRALVDQGDLTPILRQDILRSMDLQTSLIDSLRMNYNISFKGSICPPEDKIKSRDLLVNAQRKLIELLVMFVKDNTKNQNIVFKRLDALRKHFGPLNLPVIATDDFTEAHEKQLATEPGMNTEAVIVECLRNNAQLCQDEVPRELIEEFGVLVDASGDPTTCPNLELFSIVCQPNGGVSKVIPRNQEMVLDVLLSDKLRKLPDTIKAIFSSDNSSNMAGSGLRPERIVQLFSACIRQGNLRTASKLQAHRVSVEATVTVLANLCSQNNSKDFGIKSTLFSALLEFLSLQLEVLVVDPKLFRMDKTWHVITEGVKVVLRAACNDLPKKNLTTESVLAVTAALKISTTFIDGSIQLGIRELEGDRAGVLLHDEDSVYKSAMTLATKGQDDLRSALVNEARESFIQYEMDTLKYAAVKLCNVMDPSQPLDDGFDSGGDDDDEEGAAPLEVTEENTVALTSGNGNVEMVAAHHHQRLSYYEDLKNSPVSSSPQSMTKYFAEALSINPKLNRQLKARQFSLIKLLENIENNTGEMGKAQGVGGADGVGSASITWPMIVQRMQSYLNQHNHDRDETNCLRVLRVLRSHLVNARSEEDGTTLSMWDLSDSRRQAYVEKQTSYVEHGVARICLTAIATHPSNIEGNLADEGVEMLLEMTNGGNVAMQNCLSDFILNHDRDNKFAWHIKGRLDHSLNCIKDRKERSEVTFTPITPTLRHEYKNAIQTFEMLQQLCEGHNLSVQDVLREQPGHTASVDLITASANILMTLCDTSRSLMMMEEADVQLVISLLLFLTEAVQGPCPKNQELLVAMDGVVAGVDKVLQSIFDPRIRIGVQLECKSAAALLLAGLLEGRSDLVVHRMLAEDLGPDLFDLLRHSVMRTLDKAAKKKTSSVHVNLNYLKDVSLALMSSVSTIITELRKVEAFAAKMDEKPKKDKNAKTDLLEDEVRVIEINWKDRIESTSFSVPQDTAYLSAKTKDQFLKNVDLSTSEKRMKQLLDNAPVFMAEMEQIYALSKKSPLYAFINHNIVNIKWSMYALVVLLNLNIVMASYGKGSPDGYVSISDAVLEGNVQNKYKNSLLISIVLAVLNLCGYVVIVTFLAITEVPIIVKELDDYVEECVESVTMKEDEYRDPGAFTWWFVTLIFNVVFIIQHSANYPDNPNPDLYYFLVFGINMPWTLSCIRNYVVVPNTPPWRIFCVIYDVLITKPFFRNHVLLMICSINGFGASYYFPLMLMDIMNNSQIIADVARSVTDNAVQLGWVFYLFVVTMIIYAQFGLEFFEDWFTYDGDADDEEAVGCHSVVSCFVLIFYHGASTGALDDVFDPISNRDQPTYLKRVLFDLSFFVWVGVLLFNIITGLMVDGFGSLREEFNERKDVYDNACFVCGFTRDSYDDIPNFHGPSFDNHITEAHNFWSYVHFYVYLKRKNKANLTGVESYVWAMIQKENFAWIPQRNSAALQEAQDEAHEEEENMEENDTHLSKAVAKEVSSEFRTVMESFAHKQAAPASKEVKPWEGGGGNMSMSAFLGWAGMERFAPIFISKGFPDPFSLGDLSNLDDQILAQDFGLNSTEIRRLKALVELRDANAPTIGRARGLTVGSSNSSFNNPPSQKSQKRTSFFS